MEDKSKNELKQVVLELLKPLYDKLDQLSFDVVELKTSLLTPEVLDRELDAQKSEILVEISKSNEKIAKLEQDLLAQKSLIDSIKETIGGFGGIQDDDTRGASTASPSLEKKKTKIVVGRGLPYQTHQYGAPMPWRTMHKDLQTRSPHQPYKV